MITPRVTSSDLEPELLAHMKAIKARAKSYGLDFFEVIFEKLDFDTMNQIAAFGGFPVRYPHWRWGMEFDRLKKRDAYGLGRIYEMVINNDPCYAYLQESNSITDQKLVMAHVYGHADFFKCNAWFSKTNRKMMDEMANHATRVRRHIEREGYDVVEQFLDACLSIERLIDPHSVFFGKTPRHVGFDKVHVYRFPAKDYMDPFINPASELAREQELLQEDRDQRDKVFPAEPTRDVLLFLLLNAPLKDWQADVLAIVRDESYYFAPQAMTKIMNEGWATYWHSKLMTEHFLEDPEIIDYADQHSGVVHMPPGGFNPYKVGVELFRDIERRWDRGQHGSEWERLENIGDRERFDDSSKKGREKIFEVRRIYNDVNFIDEFLTPEFVERYHMYQYRRDPESGEIRVVTRDFRQIKQTLLAYLTNMNSPFISVADGNYKNRKELYLSHEFMGTEVDGAKAIEVLRALALIWGRPVHLQARINQEPILLTLENHSAVPESARITDQTPKPAHIVS